MKIFLGLGLVESWKGIHVEPIIEATSIYYDHTLIIAELARVNKVTLDQVTEYIQ